MAMSVSSEMTFISMKLQPEICPGSSAEDSGRIDTRVINTSTTRYQGKYHGYFSVKPPLHVEQAYGWEWKTSWV